MSTPATRLQTAVRTSRLVSTTRTILLSSFIYAFLTDRYTTITTVDRTDFSRYYTSATTYSYYSDVADTLTTASATAATRRLGETVVRWTKAAFLYRWLTKEPEPDVIVIDLRDTFSVGPFIALLDYLFIRLIPASHRSRLVRTITHSIRAYKQTPVRNTSILVLLAVSTSLLLARVTGTSSQLGVIIRLLIIGVCVAGTRIRLSWTELIETRPVQLLIAALEPPEPPEWDDENNDPPSNRP